MRHALIQKTSFVALLLIVAIGLSACGRRGPLEAPSASVTANPVSKEKQEAPVEDRPFILDGLI